MILPHLARITEILLLNRHRTNNCTSPAFTCRLINKTFYFPRGTSTAKKALKNHLKCRLAISSIIIAIELDAGNIPGFRIPSSFNDVNNQTHQYCLFDFKASTLVDDNRKFKTKSRCLSSSPGNDKFKIDILSYTCAISRHVSQEVSEYHSYEST